jgi:hypothetical protein
MHTPSVYLNIPLYVVERGGRNSNPSVNHRPFTGSKFCQIKLQIKTQFEPPLWVYCDITRLEVANFDRLIFELAFFGGQLLLFVRLTNFVSSSA